jgi:hypothetical protein
LCRIKELQIVSIKNLKFSKAQEPITQGKRIILALSSEVQIDNHPMMIEARKFLIEGFYQ